MDKSTDNSHDEADSISPEEADRKGKVNIVKSIMDDPDIQAIIKGALLKETVKQSMIMAALLVGILKLYDVAKTLVNFNWVGDLITSLTLIAIGLSFIIPNFFKKKT